MSTLPINLNPKSLSFYSVQNLAVPCEGPRGVPLILDFTTNPSYSISLQNTQALQLISQVQALFVDNTANSNAFTANNPVTGQTLEWPAGSQGYLNILCPNPAQLIFATTPSSGLKVKVDLLNFPVTNAVWNFSSGGGGFPAVVASVDYQGQSGSLSFDLYDPPAPGGMYGLFDQLAVTMADASAGLTYGVTYANDTGAVSLAANSSISLPTTGQYSLGTYAINNLSPSTVPLPSVIQALSGTPIHVTITVTPSAVATVSITVGNAGLLYTAGDTVFIDGGTNPDSAVFTIDTVDAITGAVLTGHISTPGSGYSTVAGNTTTNDVVTNPLAAGLELDILTLSTSLDYSYRAVLLRLA